jgi:hypothetical protein
MLTVTLTGVPRVIVMDCVETVPVIDGVAVAEMVNWATKFDGGDPGPVAVRFNRYTPGVALAAAVTVMKNCVGCPFGITKVAAWVPVLGPTVTVTFGMLVGAVIVTVPEYPPKRFTFPATEVD